MRVSGARERATRTRRVRQRARARGSFAGIRVVAPAFGIAAPAFVAIKSERAALLLGQWRSALAAIGALGLADPAGAALGLLALALFGAPDRIVSAAALVVPGAGPGGFLAPGAVPIALAPRPLQGLALAPLCILATGLVAALFATLSGVTVVASAITGALASALARLTVAAPAVARPLASALARLTIAAPAVACALVAAPTVACLTVAAPALTRLTIAAATVACALAAAPTVACLAVATPALARLTIVAATVACALAPTSTVAGLAVATPPLARALTASAAIAPPLAGEGPVLCDALAVPACRGTAAPVIGVIAVLVAAAAIPNRARPGPRGRAAVPAARDGAVDLDPGLGREPVALIVPIAGRSDRPGRRRSPSIAVHCCRRVAPAEGERAHDRGQRRPDPHPYHAVVLPDGCQVQRPDRAAPSAADRRFPTRERKSDIRGSLPVGFSTSRPCHAASV